MPEIAEVAITAELLNSRLLNKKITNIEFVGGRYLNKPPLDFENLKKNLPLKITKIDTRGKFLWFELDNLTTQVSSKNKWFIWNTFGLTGEWSFKISENKLKYLKATITWDNKKVYFFDTRNFGTFKFSQNEIALEKKLKQLSPDFLKDSDFDISKIKKYNIPVVTILMDQKKIGSGIGNYLSAEILYRAKISPLCKGSELSSQQILDLTYWIKYMVKLAYMCNETIYMHDLNKYTPYLNKKEYHPDIKITEKSLKFKVYRKKIDPYGNPVIVSKIVGSGNVKRSTYWVPVVQTCKQ